MARQLTGAGSPPTRPLAFEDAYPGIIGFLETNGENIIWNDEFVEANKLLVAKLTDGIWLHEIIKTPVTIDPATGNITMPSLAVLRTNYIKDPVSDADMLFYWAGILNLKTASGQTVFTLNDAGSNWTQKNGPQLSMSPTGAVLTGGTGCEFFVDVDGYGGTKFGDNASASVQKLFWYADRWSYSNHWYMTKLRAVEEAAPEDYIGFQMYDSSVDHFRAIRLDVDDGISLYGAAAGALSWTIDRNGAMTWGGDTNLYRNAANQLRTDDSFICDLLTCAGITATSTTDHILKLGDAAGAQKVYIKDSGNATVASIDSDGHGVFANGIMLGSGATYETVSGLSIKKTVSTASNHAFGLTIQSDLYSTNNSAYGIWMNSYMFGATGVFGLYGGLIADTGPGNIPNAYAGYMAAMTKNGVGTVITAYGCYVATQTIGTTNWSLYVAGTGKSYFGGQIQSALATGTAPIAVTSTTKCANLNVEQVDGYDANASPTNGALLVGNAVSGTFLTADVPAKTVTIAAGIVTSIV